MGTQEKGEKEKCKREFMRDFCCTFNRFYTMLVLSLAAAAGATTTKTTIIITSIRKINYFPKLLFNVHAYI
jgi:hypothetical protein